MGRYAPVLSALAVSKLVEPGLHFVGGVPNLALRISPSGSRSWVFRFSCGKRRRDMGLGPFPEISLAAARGFALEKRALLRQGVDPIRLRQERKIEMAREAAARITLKEAVTAYVAAQSAGWKGGYQAYQWQKGMQKHVYPLIGSMNVKDIGLAEVLKVLEPLWLTKAPTGSRIRAQIESVLDWAATRNYRSRENPAAWKGNLDTILPARTKVSKVKHHAALPWEQCPEFYQSLNGLDAATLALKFCILNASRSGEVRGARWPEINFEKLVWTIPAERMKAGKEHRVPLSEEAVNLLQKVPQFEGNDLIFQALRGGKLQSLSLLELIRARVGRLTVHGFRSTFRDWAGEDTNHPREVIEHALAHGLRDRTEAAYARGDLFAKRIRLMCDWSNYLSHSNKVKSRSSAGDNISMSEAHPI